MVYTSTNLLDSVKRNQTIASTASRFSDSDLLAMADEEIENTIVPMILRLHTDRLLFKETIPLVASTSSYVIPYRAVGSQLRELIIQDALTSPTWTRNLKSLEYTEGFNNVENGDPTGFYFEGDSVILVPSVQASVSDYLSYSYPIRHSALVDSSYIAVISSVNYTTGVITCTAALPSLFLVSSYYDFLVANDRSKAHLVAYDKVPSGISSTTLTFAVADIPTGLVAGDKIALANQTDTLLLPNECFKYLCKAVELKIMEAQKDLQAVAAARVTLHSALEAMESILTPRITGEGTYITKRNGLLSARRYRRIGISVTS